MKKEDACTRQVKARYAVWPSARASQAVAKCRKKHGHVRKGKAGRNLKRWTREKWKDTKTHKTCGAKGLGRSQYCRPSHRVSKKTPSRYTPTIRRRMRRLKSRGLRAQRKRR